MSKKEKKNKKVDKYLEKNMKASNEEDNLIRNFIIIVIVLVIILVAAYIASEFFTKKEDNTVNNEPIAGEVNYDIITVGTLLNRPYDDYYVLAYSSEANDAIKYATMLSMYSQNEDDKDYIKVYFLDLSNKLNSSYYNVNEDDKSNPNAKTIDELDFGDLTFLRIKKGKITEYLEDYNKIQEKLK